MSGGYRPLVVEVAQGWSMLVEAGRRRLWRVKASGDLSSVVDARGPLWTVDQMGRIGLDLFLFCDAMHSSVVQCSAVECNAMKRCEMD